MARQLKVEIIGDPSSFTRALDKAGGAAGSFGGKLAGLVKTSAIVVGAAGLGGVAAVLKVGTEEFSQSAKVAAQTDAVLKSTGGSANVTAKQVDALATSLMNKTGADDEAIKTDENMLLTFRNVRNEVGAGNDIFTQATKSVDDMATAMNGGAIPSSEQLAKEAILVGKALNDPVKGATALRRVGVTLSDQQQKQIKSFEKLGNTMGAQKIILGELDKEFGGSAEMVGKTLPGRIAVLRENFNNLSGDLVSGLAPAFTKAVSGLDSFVTKLDQAQGLHAKLDVVVGSAENLGRSLEQKIGTAVASVNWSAVWGRAKGIGSGIDQAFQSIDWGAVGSTIGDNFSAAVDKAISGTKGLPTALSNAFHSIDWNSLGRQMGPGLAAAVVSAFVALTDPGFWIKNWDLALAVGLTVFGGAIGKVAGRLGEVLLLRLSAPFASSMTALAATVEDALGPKLFSVLERVLSKLPSLVSSLLGKLVSPVTAIFNRLGGLAKFAVKVIGLDIAIREIADFSEKVIDWMKSLPGKIEHALGDLSNLLINAGEDLISGFIRGIESKADAVKSTLQHLTGKLTSWKGPPSYDRQILTGSGSLVIQGFIDGLEARYKDTEKSLKNFGSSLAISGDIMNAAHLIGLGQAEAVASGFVQGTPTLQQQIRQSLAQAMQAARQQIAESKQTLSSGFSQLAQSALQAFDDKVSSWVSPAARLLAKMQIQDTVAQLKQQLAAAKADLDQAQADLTSAQSSGDPSQVAQANQQLLAAQQAYAAAGRAVTENNLQQQDAAQTAAHAATEAKQRESLARQLLTLQTELAKHPDQYAQVAQKIVATLKKYDVPLFAAGQRIASQFADGLKSQLKQVESAAAALAAAVADHIVTHSPAKKGPLSVMSPFDIGAKLGNDFSTGLATALYRGTGLAAFAAASTAASAASGPSQSVAPSINVNVYVSGFVGNEAELTSRIVDGMNQAGLSGPILHPRVVAAS